MIAFLVALLLIGFSRLGTISGLFSDSAMCVIVFYAISNPEKGANRGVKHYEELSSPLNQFAEIGLAFLLGLVNDVISDGLIGLRSVYFPVTVIVLRAISRSIGLTNVISQSIACACSQMILIFISALFAYQISGVRGLPDLSLSIFLTALLCPLIIQLIFFLKSIFITTTTRPRRLGRHRNRTLNRLKRF